MVNRVILVIIVLFYSTSCFAVSMTDIAELQRNVDLLKCEIANLKEELKAVKNKEEFKPVPCINFKWSRPW